MTYRKLKKTGLNVSALGFGAMRLPATGDQGEHIDEAEATRMIREAIDGGVNYIDTAWPYHGGQSEGFLAKALTDGYREKVAIATKLPTWAVESEADFDRFLNEQLERLNTSSVEVYLLHALNRERWAKMKRLGALEWGQSAKADGRIKNFGFSFHDGPEVFLDILEGWNWDICQIQYNYLDEEKQAGRAGLERCAELGVDTIIMEPLYGGKLAALPDPVKEAWDNVSPESQPADIALRWLWDQEAVGVVLSGMSTMEQVQQNLSSAVNAAPGNLTQIEHDVVVAAQKAYDSMKTIPCTRCRYCMPCSAGVQIPRVFDLFNMAKGFNAFLGKAMYQEMPEAERASACIACRECEDQCPQSIIISEWMPQVDELLMQKPGA